MSGTPADLRSTHFVLDSTAENYSQIQLPRVFDPWARILLECVPCRPNEHVLDVATGPGTVARQAALKVRPSGKVVGIDISPAMLKVARGWPAADGAAAIEYYEGSGMSLPLPDSAFEVVYCQQGMQHMSDPVTALREMHRVLKPGGRLGLAAWIESPFALFRKAVADVAPGAGAAPSDFGRDAGELARLLAQAGFTAVDVQPHQLTITFEDLVQVQRLAQATSAGSAMAGLPPDKQQAVKGRILEAARSLEKNGVVAIDSRSNIATATR